MIYLPYNRGFTNITGVLDINTTKCIVPLLRSSYYAGTMPAKIVPPLTSAFPEGGFRNRAGTFCYKDHLHKCDVPVLALAADEDLICPPEAVYGIRYVFEFVIFVLP